MKYNPYSVSKIETFESCKRKFKLQYIDKIKVPDIRYHLEKGKL
ncbi:MAG: PD-(D/E)XK nuclease family protein [Nanoarchaeota archaeon]